MRLIGRKVNKNEIIREEMKVRQTGKKIERVKRESEKK